VAEIILKKYISQQEVLEERLEDIEAEEE